MARVLVTGYCAVPGPDRAGVQVPHLLGALASRHAVDVLVLRAADQAYVERFRKSRLLRVPLPEGPLRGRVEAFRRALRRQLEGAEYDVVHCLDGWAALPVLELRERLHYQVVYDAGRAPVAEPPLADLELGAQLARDEEAALLAADLVLAPTEPARRSLASRVQPDRVKLAPVGVDVDRFDWGTPPASGPARVLYAGAILAGRGIRVLLRAMRDVASRSDARLILLGAADPGFVEPLAAALAAPGLAGRVDRIGPVDNEEVAELIASATVCVAPAALEVAAAPTALYPTKILEYLACRRAVVAPRRGTIELLLRHEQNALLFDAGDATDLAAQVLRLLGDPGLRARLADAGYERVRRAHGASAARRALREAYEVIEQAAAWRVDSREVELDEEDLSPGTGSVERSAIAPAPGSSHGDTDSGLYPEPTVISSPPAGAMAAAAAAAGGTGTAPLPPDGWVIREAAPPAPELAGVGGAAGERDATPTPSPASEDTTGETQFVAAGSLLGGRAGARRSRRRRPRAPTPEAASGTAADSPGPAAGRGPSGQEAEDTDH